MSSELEKNRQRLKQLLEKPGNGVCCDCGAPGRTGARGGPLTNCVEGRVATFGVWFQSARVSNLIIRSCFFFSVNAATVSKRSTGGVFP